MMTVSDETRFSLKAHNEFKPFLDKSLFGPKKIQMNRKVQSLISIMQNKLALIHDERFKQNKSALMVLA